MTTTEETSEIEPQSAEVLLEALEIILQEAIYTTKHESPGPELRGYLQTLRGTARAAIVKAKAKAKAKKTS